MISLAQIETGLAVFKHVVPMVEAAWNAVQAQLPTDIADVKAAADAVLKAIADLKTGLEAVVAAVKAAANPPVA